LGNSAHGGHPFVHPIVGEYEAQKGAPFDQECWECADPWAIAGVCRHCRSLLKPLRRLLTAVHNLGWEIQQKTVLRKTPEESDGMKTP